jgi:aminopeptidase N
MPSLTVTEASARAAAVAVTSYDIELDLTRGEEHFGSRSTVSFRSLGARSTFVDVQAAEVVSISLNGEPVDAGLVDNGRLPLEGLVDDNLLVVDALMAYSHDGEGLHRAVDPEDKQAYVYAMTFLPAAPRVFACFDQPDLKAVFRVGVTAPTDWVVLGNGAARQVEPGRWTLAETEPLATYFATLVAGPYHSVTSEHDGIVLGLHCRQTLAPYLDPDVEELFTVTAQCFDEYHRLFGIRYPFGEYHQVFVPEYNAGAMENPACVTVSDEFVFKAQATESLRATRAMVVAHEMAHMWFGDLVTMTWWDDLWLNESFAEYMGYRTTISSTRFVEMWVEYAFRTKAWGLAADQRSSRHPIAGNGAQDTQQALTEFDGISYSKGAAALRQLNAYLGEESFIAGVVDHLQGHSFGNARLSDLLESWDRASEKDVFAWAAAWLRTEGVDTLAAEVEEFAEDGAAVVVRRRNGSPEPVSRPHAFTVTSYDARGHPTSTPVLLEEDAATVPLPGLDPEGLVLPDSGDDTWAKIVLDEGSRSRLPRLLPLISDPLARAVVWGSLREGMLDASVGPEAYLATAEAALHLDSDLAVESVLGTRFQGLAGAVGQQLAAAGDGARVQAIARRVLADAAPGSNRQLVAARATIWSTTDVDLLKDWRSGDSTPPGLVVDDDFRWQVLQTLCGRGVTDPDDIAREQDRDPSSQGVLHARRCLAALPHPETKAEVWQALTTEASLTNAELFASAEAFFRPGQVELTAGFVPRYFTEIPATSTFRLGWMVEGVAGLLFPRFAVEESTVDLATACLARDDLEPGVRRAIVDRTDDLRRVLLSRTAFPRS